jgi:transposase-like protein
MKAMSKQQLADKAGVSINTFCRWCKPFRNELEALGLQPKSKILPPSAVKFIAEKLCIDL